MIVELCIDFRRGLVTIPRVDESYPSSSLSSASGRSEKKKFPTVRKKTLLERKVNEYSKKHSPGLLQEGGFRRHFLLLLRSPCVVLLSVVGRRFRSRQPVVVVVEGVEVLRIVPGTRSRTHDQDQGRSRDGTISYAVFSLPFHQPIDTSAVESAAT